MSHCATCGAPLPPGSQFCPRCGASLNVAPPPPAPKDRVWWIVPLVVVGVAGIVLLLLMGLPFGREDDAPIRPRMETIAEGSAPVSADPAEPTATVVEVSDPPPPTTRPAARPTPAPARPPSTEITGPQAESTLRGYLTSRKYYDTGPDCVSLSTREYRNAGYTIDVHDSCNSRLLGRWRVDSKTREVFRQREDGRYLRP